MKNKTDKLDEYDADADFEYDYDWDFDDLNTHKTKDKIKWIASAVAFALIVITLVITCLQVFGKGGLKPSEWGKPDAADSDALVITPDQSADSPLRLNALKAASDNSYTITATVTPSTAVNKEIAWSIAWKNENSEWATGKSIGDYISMTSNYVRATIECKAPFGEQAEITARIRSDESITAACTVDYKQRYLGTSSELYVESKADGTQIITNYAVTTKQTITIQQSVIDAYGKSSATFAGSIFKPNCSSVYTKPLRAATFRYYVKLGDELKKAIDNYNAYVSDCDLTYPQDWVKFAEAGTDNVSEAKKVPFENPSGYDGMYVSAYLAKLCPKVEQSNGVFSRDNYLYFLSSVNSIANNPGLTGEDKFDYYVKVEATVEGVTYTDVHKIFINNCNIRASGISLDKTAVEF